jgi:hypothetical protein
METLLTEIMISNGNCGKLPERRSQQPLLLDYHGAEPIPRTGQDRVQTNETEGT